MTKLNLKKLYEKETSEKAEITKKIPVYWGGAIYALILNPLYVK